MKEWSEMVSSALKVDLLIHVKPPKANWTCSSGLGGLFIKSEGVQRCTHEVKVHVNVWDCVPIAVPVSILSFGLYVASD